MEVQTGGDDKGKHRTAYFSLVGVALVRQPFLTLQKRPLALLRTVRGTRLLKKTTNKSVCFQSTARN